MNLHHVARQIFLSLICYIHVRFRPSLEYLVGLAHAEPLKQSNFLLLASVLCHWYEQHDFFDLWRVFLQEKVDVNEPGSCCEMKP